MEKNLPTEESMAQTMQNMSEATTQDVATEAENLLLVKEYLNERYELRNNILSGKLEFRPRDCNSTCFSQLTPEAENSMIIAAKLHLGDVKCLKANLQLLIHSNDTPDYDPIHEYLHSLPTWDGKNRVAELFGRLPGISSENIYRCTIWMRSAVAHWLKLDLLHANECVPTLIGDQGCGKTVFCRRLLPPVLQEFFLDRMNLSNKFDKDMALTNNLIVVLDEFDQYTTGQQGALKQALSRNVVNARAIFKGTQVVKHRYASFLATTNNPHPLNDPTGSRRYICIRLVKGALVDNTLEIDYDQLYAQLVHEVCDQQLRFWFTPEETQQIQLDNLPYQRNPDVCEMVNACFDKPSSDEEGREFSLNEIVELISVRYPHVQCNMSMRMRVGGTLKKLGYPFRHRQDGNCYVLVLKKAA